MSSSSSSFSVSFFFFVFFFLPSCLLFIIFPYQDNVTKFEFLNYKFEFLTSLIALFCSMTAIIGSCKGALNNTHSEPRTFKGIQGGLRAIRGW